MTANDPLWEMICTEARDTAAQEPLMSGFFDAAILCHESLQQALCFNLSQQLHSSVMSAAAIAKVLAEAMDSDDRICDAARTDIHACFDRDPACDKHFMPILYFKGFQALQLYRVAHWLWLQGRNYLALYLQSQISEVFAVDIHPGAKIGSGIMIDHATGLVIGETAIVGDDVSFLHSVTLGGTGCIKGSRHPTIGRGVMISAGAKVLGNVVVGDGVKVGAGSLVLESVPAHVTVAGVPAKIVGAPREAAPALEMDQYLSDSH
tara:strand:+ start:765 stop:1553 length:789 start_codon:yes stop_codon:yes gene_type:complete